MFKLFDHGTQLLAHRLSACPCACLLNRRTRYRPVTAKHTAVVPLRSQHLRTALAGIKSDARIRRHGLNSLMPTIGTRDRRLKLHLTHQLLPRHTSPICHADLHSPTCRAGLVGSLQR
jgi:hypothetical protein